MQAALQHGVSFAAYKSQPETHATALRYLLTSPLAYKRHMEQPEAETDAMRLGRACHTAVLEPDRFLVEYALWEGGARRGKTWDAFVEQSGRKTILTEAQYSLALRLRDSVRNHPVASCLLACHGKSEVSLRWVHERTGVAIKCRLDWLSDSALIDLKSTRDPSPKAFAAAAARYGYAMQLALYADALAAAGHGALPVKLIAAQTAEPFDVVVYNLGEEFLSQGHDQYEQALDLLVECTRTNSWPGQAPDKEVSLQLPAWATPEAEEELTFGGEALF